MSVIKETVCKIIGNYNSSHFKSILVLVKRGAHAHSITDGWVIGY